MKYKLKGNINHINDINYGDYYANINIEDYWYEFNDSVVKPINSMSYDCEKICLIL